MTAKDPRMDKTFLNRGAGTYNELELCYDLVNITILLLLDRPNTSF